MIHLIFLISIIIELKTVYKYIQCYKLVVPKNPLYHLKSLFVFVSAFGLFINMISAYVILSYDYFIINIICLLILLFVILANVLITCILQNLGSEITNNNKKEILLREAKAREKFYCELEKSNKKIQEIRHNLRNQLTAIYALSDKNSVFQNEIRKIIGELDKSDNRIYTENAIINTILNSKLSIAERKKIKKHISITVPNHININCSDMGILLGNLLDNAIEACEKTHMDTRWLSVQITYKHCMLIIKICNSKDKQESNIKLSRKREYKNCGIGINSIKKVVQKYKGTVEFLDLGEQFNVNAILYGIANSSKEM